MIAWLFAHLFVPLPPNYEPFTKNKRMKRLLLGAMTMMAMTTLAQNTPASQMERLDRGVVALPAASGSGNFVSWRLLGTDDETATTFDLLRGGKVIRTDMTLTNYLDASGSSISEYQVVTKVNGTATDTSAVVKPWGKPYLKLALQRPATGAQGGTYSPNDCSVGDVDGDGQYEIIVKWDPSNAKDNSQGGMTDNVLLDCYELDGTMLWRIDLGVNIRAGAHYTQFQVYDYDGDGRAELICKTAPGSKDGTGNYVNQAATDPAIKAASNTKDWRNSGGRINGGHEYLTVFEGLTGKAIHTIAYNPNRNATSDLSEAAGTFNWGDSGKNDNGSYGNRGERHLAATAYLDGPDKLPSAIMVRGYYTFAYIWAVDFDGQQLKPRWLHRSDTKTAYKVVDYTASEAGTTKNYTPKAATGNKLGSRTMYGNGNHNLTIGDVDGDGCDEIVWGSAALDQDGTLLYATGYGHGDAIHMGAMIPGRKGLQVFQIHEEGGYTNYGWDLHDAATGEVLFKATGTDDNGRGMAAQLSNESAEWWFSSAADRNQRSAVTGEIASTKSASVNFRIYWDGSLQDALLDGNVVDKWNGSGFSRLFTPSTIGPSSTCNGTKKTPNLLADLFGDWREELVLWGEENGNSVLAIYSTNIETGYAIPTLMHDHTYRMAVCWQNTAYNQPPHLGYNLMLSMQPGFINAADEQTAAIGEELTFTCKTRNVKSVMLDTTTLPDGTKKRFMAPDGFTFSFDSSKQIVVLTGTPTQTGDYQFLFKMTTTDGESLTHLLTVHVSDQTGIKTLEDNCHPGQTVYDVQGRCRRQMKTGLNIIRECGKTRKIIY